MALKITLDSITHITPQFSCGANDCQVDWQTAEVAELGIFGTFVADGDKVRCNKASWASLTKFDKPLGILCPHLMSTLLGHAQALSLEVVGHLLRSKGQQTNQGGVFVGNVWSSVPMTVDPWSLVPATLASDQATVDVPFLVPSDIYWRNVTA